MRYVARMAQQHGHEQAEEKSVGCGKSGSVSIKNGQEFMKNSVSQFDKKGKKEEEHEFFECSECGWQASGAIGDNNCGGCGFSKADYAKKYGVVCD
jgi:ribosomal protein L37E